MHLGDSKDSALTKQMLQQFCMFAGCRVHFVRVVMLWFIETTKTSVQNFSTCTTVGLSEKYEPSGYGQCNFHSN